MLFGGIWGADKVIPTKGNEPSFPSIPKFATLIVALVLVSFGLFYLLKSGLITVPIPNWVTNFAYWFILSIFILREIESYIKESGKFNDAVKYISSYWKISLQ